MSITEAQARRALRHADIPGTRRALGLARGSPCDTTLYRLLAEHSPAGLEETVPR